MSLTPPPRPSAHPAPARPTRALPALLLLLLAGLGLAPARLAAQGTDASIVGQVRLGGAEAAPAAGVTVTARNEATGLAQTRVTNAAGRYSFNQLPLGGPYTVTARRLGYRAATQSGIVLRLGDRVPADFVLTEAAADLEPVRVTGTREAGRSERVGASTIIAPKEIEQIPAQNRSFTDLASLAPNVSMAGTGGVITSSFSVAGGRVTGTDLRTDGVQAKNTLWGAGFGRGPYSLSMEAVREFEVVTNVYDVTQGRQGAGAINVATKFGTNETQGSLFAYHRNARLTTTNFLGVAPVNFRNTQWGGSAGGPIRRDKLHYFVAFDRQDLSEPYRTMDIRDAPDEVQFNVARDSVRRFLDILERRYGLPGGESNVGQFTRASVLNTVFGRLDWAAGANHRVTLRHTYSDWINPNSLTDRFLAVSESFGTAFSRENQTLLSVKSALASGVDNDLRIAYTRRVLQNREQTRIPRGWVQVSSTVPDGRGGTRNTANQILQFGGMRTTPEWQTDGGIQLINVTRVERGNATFTFGTDNSLNDLAMYVSIETNGRFIFPNLAALEAGRPSEYYRLVPINNPEPSVSQWVYDGGLFAQGDWRIGRRVAAMAGLRWDVAAFLTPAERNPLLEQELGLRTDRRALDVRGIQPRGQLVWDVRGTGTDVVRFGGGLFTAQPHHMSQINHLLNDGRQLAEVLVTGNAVPTPDFASYRRDLATVPGVVAGAAAAPAYVNLMGPNFRVPRTWKTDLAYRRRFGERAALGLAAQYSRTGQNYHYFDRNLREPAFRIDNEQNRAVFVPAASIPARGNQGAGARTIESRLSPRFARVLELRSEGVQDQRAVIVDGAIRLWRDGSISGSYTYNKTRDNTSFNCCIAVTASFTPVASDPRDLSGSWGPSNTDFRHKAAVFGSLPSVWGFRLSGRYIGLSGTPFSAMVAGDVNGDEFNNNNDLAMIFDPADPRTPANVAASMRRVLENPDNRARAYLQENLGRIASRNGASNPFYGRLDLRLAKSVPSLRGQRAELSVDVFNFANLLDRDWGGQWVVPGGNQALLSITGFDAAARRYTYSVNENFGVARKQGDPYQIQLGVRYSY